MLNYLSALLALKIVPSAKANLYSCSTSAPLAANFHRVSPNSSFLESVTVPATVTLLEQMEILAIPFLIHGMSTFSTGVFIVMKTRSANLDVWKILSVLMGLYAGIMHVSLLLILVLILLLPPLPRQVIATAMMRMPVTSALPVRPLLLGAAAPR